MNCVINNFCLFLFLIENHFDQIKTNNKFREKDYREQDDYVEYTELFSIKF